MEEDVFLECMRKKKLFDIKDRPLRLYRHLSFKEDDSFFRCVSIAIMGTDEYRVDLRSACVMRFIRLLFYQNVDSVAEFLKIPPEDIRVKGLAYQDEAIQMWLVTHTQFGDTTPKEVFKRNKDALLDLALDFVRKNNQVGYLSCRFTFSYLLVNLFSVRIHLYDQLDTSGLVHQQPVIQRAKHSRGEPPNGNSDDDRVEETPLHIYMWKAVQTFKLLVPIVERSVSRTRYWIEEQMNQQKHKYQLRKSDEDKMRNVRVCDLDKLRDTEIHVCDVPKGELSERCIYQIYPAGGDFKLHMEPQHHLYVFCVRESNQDIRPYLETLVELKHDITYPFFMLKKDTKRIVVLVMDKFRDEIIDYVKKELNVD